MAVSVGLPPRDAPAQTSPTDAEALEVDVEGSGDWPMFHGDRRRTGASLARAILAPRLRWRAEVGLQSWLNSPVVVGAMVIVPSSGKHHNTADPDDAVLALELRTGKTAWRAPLPADANGVAASKDRVFVTSDDGHVRALERKHGSELWKQRGAGKMYTHPLLFENLVVVGDAGGNVRAYTEGGAPVFAVALEGAIRGGASADARSIYAASQGGEVVALTPQGREIWRTRIDHPGWAASGLGPLQRAQIYAAPVVTDTMLIVPLVRDTYYKDQPAFVALDKRTGNLRWRARGPGEFGNVRSTPALVASALVYAEPYSGDVAAIASTTGRLLYRKRVGGCFFPHWASAAAAADVAYIQRFDGVLHAVRATDGASLWRFYVGDSRHAGATVPAELEATGSCEWEVPHGNPAYSPVAVAGDGTVLVGTAEGFLYAIEES